jgi:hypothetical protein
MRRGFIISIVQISLIEYLLFFYLQRKEARIQPFRFLLGFSIDLPLIKRAL